MMKKTVIFEDQLVKRIEIKNILDDITKKKMYTEHGYLHGVS